jgi:hypothetical protein
VSDDLRFARASGDRVSVTHPTERRKLTIAELKRICGSPMTSC